MAARVKHHGFAHFVLAVVLFLIAVVVFGGWVEGPVTSGLFLGVKVYGFTSSAAAGDLQGVSLAGATILQLAVIFFINLIIYYAISSVLIFVFNLVFGERVEKRTDGRK